MASFCYGLCSEEGDDVSHVLCLRSASAECLAAASCFLCRYSWVWRTFIARLPIILLHRSWAYFSLYIGQQRGQSLLCVDGKYSSVHGAGFRLLITPLLRSLFSFQS